MSSPALVVGTAGHIDHGKTSLVRSLTGIDLDRLPEEQARGITIALGATPMDLPDGRRVGMIDVPGHERLIRTMVAGATGIDAVLLCVSAVDGAMPQTREHLAILDLLGVSQGAVVLTMADLVDDDMLELAEEDVSDTVAGTFLEGCPVVAFSAIDGRGRDAVLDVLTGFADTRRSSEGPFRLPVDRVFSRPGFGTVATGTVWSGQVEDGATVTALPGGATARVRGIEVHGEKVAVAYAGRRTALNLAGAESDDVSRGHVIVVGEVPAASMIDVRYRHLPDAPALRDGAGVRVLLGTAERMGRMHLAEPPSAGEDDGFRPGRAHWAQVRLDEPLPCLPGDRFVVRRPSPQTTLGGGEVLDPWAPRLRQRDRVRAAEELARLAEGDALVWLERAGEQGLTDAQWRARGKAESGRLVGDRWFAPTVALRLQGALLEALAAYHHDHPLSLGAHRRELRRGRLAHVTDRVFDDLVNQLASDHAVVVEGPLVRIAGFAVELTPEQERRRRAVVEALLAAGLAGAGLKELAEAHGPEEVPALMRLLAAEGVVQEVTGVGWVASSHLAELEDRLRDWFTEHDVLSPPEFKELTGLTRKAAIPLLEWLDAARLTQRADEGRVAGPALRTTG